MRGRDAQMAGRDDADLASGAAQGGAAMFRAAFETTGQGMAILGLDGRFIEVNEAGARMLGYSPAELRQRDFRSIAHPEDRDADLARVRSLLEGSADAFEMEKRILHRDGHVVWAQLNVGVIRDKDARPLYLVSLLQDITERRRVDAALRDNELRFRTLVSSLPGVLFCLHLTAAGEIRDLYVGPQVTGMLGIAPETLAREQLILIDFTHPDDRSRLVEELRQSARRPMPSTIEIRQIRRSDGEVRWWQLHMTARPVSESSFELDGIAFDVTHRKSVEDRLRLRERALDSISQAIIIADAGQPDYPIIYVNPAFERITGYPGAEAMGRNCRFLQGAASEPAVLTQMRDGLRKGGAFRSEVVNHRRDGTTFINDLSITPVRDPHGRLTHFVGVISDVTLRHNLEAQLRQAQKIEAVGRLTGGIAHDFNNLLMVAHGNLELMAEALATGDRQVGEFLDEARKAVERGAELTRRLLAFARAQPLRASAVDMNQVIVEFVPMLRRMLGEDVNIETALQPGSWTCLVDRGQIENALLALAVNARDAMPRGGHLTIATEAVSLEAGDLSDLKAGSYIRKSVTDTGEGMAEEVMEHAFDPFFTTKEAGKGTGQGLGIVYGFTRQSAGHAKIASEVGRGTTVSLYLPLARPQVQTSGRARRRAALAFGSETILLVEDDAAVRGTVRMMLQDIGYRVIEFGDAQSALDHLSRERDPDLVLTDLVMPGQMNGWQLALKIWRRRSDQKILFSTGYTDNPLIQQMSEDPRARVLRKPYSRRDLAEAVRTALEERVD
jgi:two-component system cell cycle sensor histidine kinase/response regulator CckA